MNNLTVRNKKIIEAVIEKANRICPQSLAMIGIYGSFETGDFHEKSDLDLLILINDNNGYKLSSAFIQDDSEVGHDIYCTSWEDLEEASLYNNPNISKLMDSEIVYCLDEKYMEKLKSLREKARKILSAPLSKEDYDKAEKMMKEAEHYYLSAEIEENITDIWVQAGYTIYYVENAIALLNKKYFRLGTKRIFDELKLMENKPDKLCEMIEKVTTVNNAQELKEALKTLVYETMRIFQKVKSFVLPLKKDVTADFINGTYEEAFSNWRNKMYVASKENNKHLAFMSLCSFNAMISAISEEVNIPEYNALKVYDPKNLEKTAKEFDNLLGDYLNEYQKVNLQVERYKDIDSFVQHYLAH